MVEPAGRNAGRAGRGRRTGWRVVFLAAAALAREGEIKTWFCKTQALSKICFFDFSLHLCYSMALLRPEYAQ
jgi:hypothetical protein